MLGVTITVTGHDGSALTHGENYLTEYLPWKAGEAAVAAPTFPTELPVEKWAAYEHIVRVLDTCKAAGVQEPYLDTIYAP